MSRLPHFLYIRLKDGDKVVSIMCRAPFTRRKIPSPQFLLEAESNPGATVAAGRVRSTENSNDIGN
jgi:hypothetical protein